MNNRFVIILIACVAVFLGLIVFIKKDASAPSDGQAVAASNHVQGAGTSGVTLVEYGDFQCAACGAYYPLLKEVKAKYGDQITFQLRHFPIVSIHPNTMSAHRAAEAAGMQDKFWEMHDLLYERQSAWSDSNNPSAIFKGYAEEIGLDVDRYNTDLVKAEIGSIIQEDLKAGKALDVTATPGFVLDGKLIETNPRSVEDFSKLIDEAIAARQQQ